MARGLVLLHPVDIPGSVFVWQRGIVCVIIHGVVLQRFGSDLQYGLGNRYRAKGEGLGIRTERGLIVVDVKEVVGDGVRRHGEVSVVLVSVE